MVAKDQMGHGREREGREGEGRGGDRWMLFELYPHRFPNVFSLSSYERALVVPTACTCLFYGFGIVLYVTEIKENTNGYGYVHNGRLMVCVKM